MKNNQKPLLSIGMIVKNEIRSIEKCLKALQPLRDAIPCELVIADTGSTDGTREVVARYADTLFDFEWIKDFSAARNAVLDKCSGDWYLTVDADEYLDPNFTDFVTLLTEENSADIDFYAVVQRNYADKNDLSIYNDFYAVRMARMGSGVRYVGTIHESFAPPEDGMRVAILENVILWHDGYLEQDNLKLIDKKKRNIELLEKQLEEDPNNMRSTMQAADAAYTPELQELYARRLVELLEANKYQHPYLAAASWQRALIIACDLNLREFSKWYAEAKLAFPDSFFVRVDGNHFAVKMAWKEKNYTALLEYGAAYLDSLQALRTATLDEKAELVFGNLYSENTKAKTQTELLMACSYAELEQWNDCHEILKRYPTKKVGKEQLPFWLQAMGSCASGLEDTKIWKKFNDTLARLEDWENTGSVVKLALENNQPIPESFFTQSVNRLIALATAIGVECKEKLPGILMKRTAQDGNDDDLKVVIWNHALLSSALLTADWDSSDTETLEWLMGTFALLSEAFLNFYYNPQLLQEDSVALLPELHHFSWLFVQAKVAQASGNTLEYVRWLRKALKAVPAMKEMVEHLLGKVKSEVEELKERRQQEVVPPELLALATQVRTVLAQYDPNDPAVQALKQSSAYQKVAHLIE